MKKTERKEPVLVLASSSPRRRDYFRGLGLSFHIIVPKVTESPRRGEEPVKYARRLAVEKARDTFSRLAAATVSADLGEMDLKLNTDKQDAFLIVAADTIVVLGRRILEKPKNTADARRMLSALSGKTHKVITGVCLVKVEKGKPVREKSFTSTTTVVFKKLTAAEIAGYIATGEPMDKAGAYAIQGIGSFLVKSINGSYANVVGLPVAELVDLLRKDFGVSVF